MVRNSHSSDDLSSKLRLAVTEQVTGLGPEANDRLRRAFLALAEVSRRREDLTKELGETPAKLHPAMRRGRQLGLLAFERRFWFASEKGLDELLRSASRSQNQPLLALSPDEIDQLQRFDFQKIRFTQHKWIRSTRIIARIGRQPRRVTFEQLAYELSASELSWTDATVQAYVQQLRKARVLTTRPPLRFGANPGTEFTVQWPLIRKLATRPVPISLEPPRRALPLTKRKLATAQADDSQCDLIDKLNKANLRINRDFEVRALRLVLRAIGSGRVISSAQLHLEQDVPLATIQKGKSLGTRHGLISSKTYYDSELGKTTRWTVHWDKVAKLVGDGNPSAADAHSTEQPSAPRPPKKRGPKPKWNHLKAWLKDQAKAHADWDPADFREAYRREFPEATLPNHDSMRTYVSAAKRGKTTTRSAGAK
jgi:hypothetical protein